MEGKGAITEDGEEGGNAVPASKEEREFVRAGGWGNEKNK